MPLPQSSLSARKPLRSSPLAGPVLSYSQQGGNQEKKPKPVKPLVAPTKEFLFDVQGSYNVNNAAHTSPPHSPTSLFTSSVAKSQINTKLGVSHVSPDSPSSPKSTESSKDWMSSNIYESTPRFSRLSMAASGVVLPVSVKDHKRMSVSKLSSSSTLSPGPKLGDLARLSTSLSMPSLTRTESGTSLESMSLTVPSPHSVVSFVDSESVVSVRINEDAASEFGLAAEPSHCSAKLESEKKGLKGWKGFSLRTRRSLKSLKYSSRSDLGDLEDVPPTPPLPTPSPFPENEAIKDVKPKRSGTIKRLLKAIPSRKRSQKT